MWVFTILISRVHTTTQLFKILEMAFLRHQVIIYIKRCSFLKEYNHTHCIHTWLLQWPYCLGQGENCNLLWRPNSHVHYQPTLAPVYRNHISQTSIYARCGTNHRPVQFIYTVLYCTRELYSLIAHSNANILYDNPWKPLISYKGKTYRKAETGKKSNIKYFKSS